MPIEAKQNMAVALGAASLLLAIVGLVSRSPTPTPVALLQEATVAYGISHYGDDEEALS